LSQNRRNLLHGLKLLLNTADRKGLVTFNINVSQEFSDLLYFLPDTTGFACDLKQMWRNCA
ncbi:MAG: hypothetical protein MI685_05375, partial [Chlorobiales bacterium]|nr:hypothetical protein [Chlorobiales bacterium]